MNPTDTEMLDWLHKNHHAISKTPTTWLVADAEGFEVSYESLREAITAAMEAQAKAEADEARDWLWEQRIRVDWDKAYTGCKITHLETGESADAPSYKDAAVALYRKVKGGEA